MARKLGEAFVEIKARMEGLASGLSKARGLVDGAVGDMVEQLGFVESALARVRNLGLGLTIGVSLPIVLASRSFIAMGSAANELENRFNVTFGSMAKDVKDWSGSLSASFGRSVLDIRGFVQSFNTLLTPVGLGAEATRAMSKELTQLVFDFGSFADLAPAEAFIKLQSGLAGMSRPLAKFMGEISAATVRTFALKKGIIESSQQLNEAQKIVARFGLMMERSTEMTNDAIRTGKDWANQLQRMLGLIKDTSAAIGHFSGHLGAASVLDQGPACSILRTMKYRYDSVAAGKFPAEPSPPRRKPAPPESTHRPSRSIRIG
ncbi:MAG: hypothetical protein IID41_01025 [Planctomycetes bacterium]|nr:hypothetical protein [Planctomycetota bacterium]